MGLSKLESFAVKHCELFDLSEWTVHRMIALFNQTGSVKCSSQRNGP